MNCCQCDGIETFFDRKTVRRELKRYRKNGLTSVDASMACVEPAREEASRQVLVDSVSYHHGDFVDLAPKIDDADIVTLDRAICCYDDMKRFVELSSQRARKL